MTELRGTVIYAANNGDIYILPDDNYKSMLLNGNFIVPNCPVNFIDPLGIHPSCLRSSYDYWTEHILKNYQRLGFPPVRGNQIPVIKLEANSLTNDIPPTSNFEHTDFPIAHVNLLDSYSNSYTKISLATLQSHFNVTSGNYTNQRDHVVVYGLYVQEMQHNMFQDVEQKVGSCERPFVRMPWDPTQFMTCYGHTELHPYFALFIYKINDNNPPPINTERHTVVAPIYNAYFSDTYGLNKLYGFAGHLADDSIHNTITDHFFIKAPAHPSQCASKPCRLDFQESVLHKILAPGSTVSTSYEIRSDDVFVEVTAFGYFATIPTVFQADYSTTWVPDTPPSFDSVTLTPDIVGPSNQVTINTKIIDDVGVKSVSVIVRGPSPSTDIIGNGLPTSLRLISGYCKRWYMAGDIHISR